MIDFFRGLFPLKLDTKTQDFLIECLQKLPRQPYGTYADQLRAGLVRYAAESEVDHPTFKNYISFTYDPKVSVKFQKLNGRFWRVRDILVQNHPRTEIGRVSIFFSHGLVCGFACEAAENFGLDRALIDVSQARQETLDSPDPSVKMLISPEDQDLINWADVYEVKIEGIMYFHIKSIGDGDFIGLDENGFAYEIRHDPFEITGLDGSLQEILGRYAAS